MSTMAIPRNSLRGFLTQAKSALRAAPDTSQNVTLVIGNESADLDSMTCSVLYAYIRSLSPSRNTFSPLYVPITNIPASDIQLRPEYLALFRHANIDPSHLITLDDLPDLSIINAKLRPENTKWILVDHNALQGQLGKIYSKRVGGVIDHHQDEDKVPENTGSEPRIIEKTGSCTSLVANYCRQAWDALSNSALPTGAAHTQGDSLSDDGALTTLWDAQVAQLGLASILIDTANLQSKDKTTDHDSNAVAYLEAKIMSCPKLAAGYNRDKFYQEIESAKKDIGGLKLQDILRKDYKEWTEGQQKLGISSVVKPIDFLQDKARDEANAQSGSVEHAFEEALSGFSAERRLNLYALMTTFTSSKGEFERELLIVAFDNEAISAAETFASDSKGELGLEDWHGSDNEARDTQSGKKWFKVWRQKKVQHSRKRVAPLLREAMK